MNHRHGCFFHGILLSFLAYPMASQAEGPGQRPASATREEQAAFVLADPELTIELVASEPEVASPVAIAWDEEGRLFVAEMLDYPDRDNLGPDPDAGGPRRRRPIRRPAARTVFADGLPFPNSVLPVLRRRASSTGGS